MAARKGPRYTIVEAERKVWQEAARDLELSVPDLAKMIGKHDPKGGTPGTSTIYRVIWGEAKAPPLVPAINKALAEALRGGVEDGNGHGLSEDEQALLEAYRSAVKAGMDPEALRHAFSAMVRHQLEDRLKDMTDAIELLSSS